jgi:hypothetical protein
MRIDMIGTIYGNSIHRNLINGIDQGMMCRMIEYRGNGKKQKEKCIDHIISMIGSNGVGKKVKRRPY